MKKPRFVYYNANPFRKHVGDCVYRALSVFLDKTWREALNELVSWTADRGLVSNYRSGYTAFLADKGYSRKRKPRDENKKEITVGQFCELIAEDDKVYLVSMARHLTVVRERTIFDTWDCSNRIVDGYWERM